MVFSAAGWGVGGGGYFPPGTEGWGGGGNFRRGLMGRGEVVVVDQVPLSEAPTHPDGPSVWHSCVLPVRLLGFLYSFI